MFRFPKNKSKSKFLAQWIFFLLVIGGVYQHSGWVQLDEYYNDYWRKKIATRSIPDQQILIIEIDDKSLSDLESEIGRWPWPRSKHAFLVEGLIAANVNAIVFDLFFSERELSVSSQQSQFSSRDLDQFFAESVSGRKNIFFAATILPEESPVQSVALQSLPQDFIHVRNEQELQATSKVILPHIINQQDWNIGLINFFADQDGVARRYPRVLNVDGWKLYSLPQKLVNYFFNVGNQVSAFHNETFHLKYKGTTKVPFNSISYSDAAYLLDNQKQLELFSDKIVIIGATATGLNDLRDSPIMPLYPGTSILATAIDNLLNDDYLLLIERYYGLALLLLTASVIWLATQLTDGYKNQLYLSILVILATFISLYFISFQLSQIDLLFPAASVFTLLLSSMITVVFYRGLKEYLSKQHTMQTFTRFMDPVIVKQLLDDENWQQKIANKSSQVSVLFSDIRGFTSLSEKRSAEQIIRLLNDYFDRQVEAIFNTRGTLDKFIGDAVMAFWGAPVEDKNHAIHAVTAALQMVENLKDFRQSLPEDLQSFDVGIGIHSGEAVVGMLGSSKRFDYTAIGDTVNLASRIEGATKGIARVLVSEATKILCGDHFLFEYRGEFAVKGRDQKVKLYEPKTK